MLAKMNHQPRLSGFNRDFAHSEVWCVSIRPCQANCCN